MVCRRFPRLRSISARVWGFAGLGLLLAGAAIWYGFDEGIVIQRHRVTVTHVVDHPVYVPPSGGGVKIGGLPGRSQREYQVLCMTVRGQRCTVVTEPHAVYRTGDLIAADVELWKPVGEFGWTFTGKLYAWLALLAFGTALWQGWRAKGVSDTAATPPPPSHPAPAKVATSDSGTAALFRPAVSDLDDLAGRNADKP